MHLFVLDLNGVLVSKRGGGRDAILRNKVKEFISQITRWSLDGLIKVAVWTSMTSANANIIVDQLFDSTQKSNLMFTWFSDQCTPCHDRPFKKHKDLRKVWNAFPEFNETNTTLIDDSEFKGQCQPNNLYLVNTFDVKKEDDTLEGLQQHIFSIIVSAST